MSPDPVNPLTERQEAIRRAGWGATNGRKRRQTPSERRRVSETWSGRIGADMRDYIKELACRYDKSQGEIARQLLEFARQAEIRGDLVVK